MERYRDMTIRKKSSLKMLRNLIFFILLIIFTFWYIFKDQDLNELIDTIKSSSFMYVLLGALLMFFYFIIESHNIRQVLYGLGENKLPFYKHLKFTFICFFFSAITPASTGGQPVEVYYMAKEGIAPAHGTLAMLVELSCYQIGVVLFAILSAILFPSIISGKVAIFFFLGLFFNTFVFSMMLVSIFSKKATKKIVDFFIKIISYFKVRNLDKKREKILKSLEQYNKSASYIMKHKVEFLKSLIRVLMQIICYFSITYCIYRSFGLNELSYFRVFAMQAILFNSVCSLPLPGSIGVSESLFLKIFIPAFGESLLSSAMLLFRFSSFYLFIILSTIIVIVNSIRTRKIVSVIDKDISEIDNEKVYA